MQKLIFFILFISSNFLFAQEPNILWEKTFGNEKNDQAYKVILTSDNHYLLIGYTQPKGCYDLDFWVSKINSDGTLIWDKNFGTDQMEIGYDAKEDQEGNFILTGIASTSDNSGQVWVIKINKNGDLIWDKKYGGKNEDVGKSVLLNKDGNIIIGGNSEGEVSAFNHAYCLVLDKNGNKIKDSKYGGDFFQKDLLNGNLKTEGAFSIYKGETCNKIINSKNGGFLFIGTTITKARENLGTDGWLVKLNKERQLIWDKNFGAIGGDNVYDIIENENGDILVIGEYYDKPIHRVDIWLTKFDKNGDSLFHKIYGSKNFGGGKALALLPNNEMLIAGFTSTRQPTNNKYISADTISKSQQTKLLNEGWNKMKFEKETGWKLYFVKSLPLTPEQEKIKIDRDIWIGKIDADGNLIWEKTFGGDDDDEAVSMIIDNENHIILTGYTRSKGNGLKDIWVLKLE